ncbi:unnamed protein product [Brugia timori]|uniref:Uncharacterized protein n=1 Tax=Brugia timori TaxID=42155 RepID=A0A0R3R934_9BILA|nr:unnamed protein product [Brugia timori]
MNDKSINLGKRKAFDVVDANMESNIKCAFLCRVISGTTSPIFVTLGDTVYISGFYRVLGIVK